MKQQILQSALDELRAAYQEVRRAENIIFNAQYNAVATTKDQRERLMAANNNLANTMRETFEDDKYEIF